jgi:hypothetical protein
MKIHPPRPVSLRPIVIGGFLLLGVSCDEHVLSVAHQATTDDAFALTAEWPAFAQSPSSKVDILFMVDDSLSMQPLQEKLTAGFSDFMTALEHLPGGVPDLHLGVVSSSMGAGRNTTVDHCPQGGDQGILQSKPVGSTCAGVQLSGNFITAHTDATSRQLVTNYGSASLSDAFGCIALLGDQGCGFEHQFGSVLRALGADGAPAPAQNAGFLRPDAFLAVILVTNEDDCSAPAESDLFDDTTPGDPLSSPLGPLQSYRCNEFGHLCQIDGRLQHPPRTMATGPLEGCRSAEDGRLFRVKDFVAALRAIKADPAFVFFAAITGPATPYVVDLGPSQIGGDPSRWPFIEHSCVSSDGDYADPSVRIEQAVNDFGAHGVAASICDDTLGPLLNQISTQLSRPMAAACVTPPAPGGPGCTVVDRFVQADGTRSATRLPACAENGSVAPCWELIEDATNCGTSARRLWVNRSDAVVNPTLITAIDCTAPHP